MRISQFGVDEIKYREGFREEAYQDEGGIWTVGYGHTQGVTRYTKVTKEQADSLLRKDLAHAELAIKELVSVPLKQYQYDTLVSFIFNVGAGAFRRSTLLEKLNQEAYDAVPGELQRWVYVKKKKSEGLALRRLSEVLQWNNANESWKVD